MRLYTVKDEYINFLRKYDTKVAENKNHKRPYVGVLIEVDGIKFNIESVDKNRIKKIRIML